MKQTITSLLAIFVRINIIAKILLRNVYFIFLHWNIYIYIYTHTHTQWVQVINCCHFKLSILHTHFVYFRYSLLCCKPEVVEYCQWGKLHYDVIHSSRNLKMACCTVWHGCWKPWYKFSECLGVNLMSDSYWWKPNTQSTSWCLGWSLAMVTLCLQSYSQTQTQHQVLREGSAILDREGDC